VFDDDLVLHYDSVTDILQQKKWKKSNTHGPLGQADGGDVGAPLGLLTNGGVGAPLGLVSGGGVGVPLGLVSGGGVGAPLGLGYVGQVGGEDGDEQDSSVVRKGKREGYVYLKHGEDDINSGCLNRGCGGYLGDDDICKACGARYEALQDPKYGWRFRPAALNGDMRKADGRGYGGEGGGRASSSTGVGLGHASDAIRRGGRDGSNEDRDSGEGRRSRGGGKEVMRRPHAKVGTADGVFDDDLDADALVVFPPRNRFDVVNMLLQKGKEDEIQKKKENEMLKRQLERKYNQIRQLQKRLSQGGLVGTPAGYFFFFFFFLFFFMYCFQ
jgi:hypothetical protein